jgi:hypothetical protein
MSQSEGKVFPGQPFHPPPAIIWNNMVDAGRAWADGRLNSPPGNPNRSRQTDLIKIKNSTGENRAQGEVLKISGKVIEQVDNEFIWLDGVEPTADCRFGILKHPLLIDEVDTAQVSGVTIAKVNVMSVDHTFADVEDGEYLLQSADEGPLEILFMPDGTDPIPEGGETRECVVRFAGGGGGGTGAEKILFEIKSIARGVGLNCNAMEVEVLNVSCGATIVSQGDIVIVYDELGCVFNGPEHLLLGKRGYAVRMENPDYPDTEILEFAEGTEDIAVPTGLCRWAAEKICCIEESV